MAIRLEHIKSLPRALALQLAPYSAEEYRAAEEFGIDPVGSADFAVAIYQDEVPIMALITSRPTFLSPVYLQFMLCEGFSPWVARGLAPLWRGFRYKNPVIETAVEKTLRTHCKFAKFFGFRPSGRTFDFLGREYEVYEARS